MFKSFKGQVIFPVAAIVLVLIFGSAIGFSLWAVHHEEAAVQQEVDDKVSSIQGIFATTAQLMRDRTQASMSLLEEQINAKGGAERGPQVNVHGTTVADLIVGGKGQANNFDMVDYVTRFNRGTATLFSKDGQRFVRIATNVKQADGSRAVGTELGTTTKAYDAVTHGQAYYGVVDILGNAYFTGYQPLSNRAGDVIGLTYVGYKAELPVLSTALDGSHLLKTGFVAVVDDKDTVRYQPSWIKPEAASAAIANTDGSWVVSRLPLSDWGLTIVSAYPKAEMQNASRRIGYWVVLAGVVIALIVALVLFVMLDRQVMKLLGGEPSAAATYMKRMSDGDLAVNIVLSANDKTSLMASLKVMELKLKNLVTAVRGGAAEVGAQAKKFEAAASTFQRTRDETSAQDLLWQAKAMTGTLAILEKSVDRFKT